MPRNVQNIVRHVQKGMFLDPGNKVPGQHKVSQGLIQQAEYLVAEQMSAAQTLQMAATLCVVCGIHV